MALEAHANNVVATFDVTFDTADGVDTSTLGGTDADQYSIECTSSNAARVAWHVGQNDVAATDPDFTAADGSAATGFLSRWFERGSFWMSPRMGRITSLKVFTDAVAGSDITLRLTFYRVNP